MIINLININIFALMIIVSSFLLVSEIRSQSEETKKDSTTQTTTAHKDSTSAQDSTKKRELSFNGYPYAYYTPETQLAFGVGGIFLFYASASSITKWLIFTSTVMRILSFF